MRRFFITLFGLVPLAILVSLSCPAKQTVKELLGISVNFPLQTERGGTACVFLSEQKRNESLRKIDRKVTKVQSVQNNSLYRWETFLPYQEIPRLGILLSILTSVPIFLACRKLII